MIIGTYIFGIRKELLNHLPEEVARRQTFIFNMLGLMLIVLALLGTASGLIFGLVLFNHWGLAIACGIFLGGVFFLLLQLLLFLFAKVILCNRTYEFEYYLYSLQ